MWNLCLEFIATFKFLRMKKIAFLTILHSAFFLTNAQVNIDIAKLKTLKDDTLKVKLLEKIGDQYSGNKMDSAIYYYNLQKILAKKLNFNKGIFSYYTSMSHVYNNMGQYDKAFITTKERIILAKQIGDKKQLAYGYANLGNIYGYIKKQDSCAYYTLKAISIFELTNNKLDAYSMYVNIGGLYIELNQYDKAEKFLLKALALQKQGIGSADNYIILLLNLSDLYERKNQIDSALYYAYETVKISEKEKNYYMEIIGLQNVMFNKIRQQKYSELLPLAKKITEIGNTLDTAECTIMIDYSNALAFYYNNNSKLAEKYALRAFEMSKKNKLDDLTKRCCIILNSIESNLGNYALSDKFYNKLDSLKTLELNSGILENIQELEKKYETQKKQVEIIALKSKNEKKETLNKILIGASIALLFIGFLGYRNFRNKQKIQNLKISELEKDKQLFAVDAMLKGQEEERSRIAKDLHDGLGGLLSGTKLSFTTMKENLILTPENAIQFDKSLSMLDTTISDLRKVAHNLMPEALVKFGLNDALRDFCNSIQSASSISVDYQKLGIDRKISNTGEIFIYRIIQELVNNAVKHAEAKEIIVQLSVESNKVLVTVEDNGKGYDATTIQSKKGAGLDNIIYRVQYLNGKIDTVTSLSNGTSVNIELNV